MKFASNLGFGSNPHSLGKDHPEGILAGVHGNYHFTYPPGDKWPVNKRFVENYHKRWNQYPALEAEGAYTAIYLIKQAIEKANQLIGGWPEPEMVIQLLKGSMIQAPSGYVYVRPEDNSAMKDVAVGFSKNLPGISVSGMGPGSRDGVSHPIRHCSRGLAEARARPRGSLRRLQLDAQDLVKRPARRAACPLNAAPLRRPPMSAAHEVSFSTGGLNGFVP